MLKSMSKANILSELCEKTSVPKKDLARVFDALTAIVCREAVNGFTIPGLCKFKVVQRKESRRWNPALKKRILVKEHSVLKVMPIKKAKEIITPRPDDLIQILPDEPARAQPAASHPDLAAQSGPAPQPNRIPPQPAPPPAASPRPAAHPEPSNNGLGNILFMCPQCNGTVMAEAGQGGMTGECPMCNALIKIPAYDRKASEATTATSETKRSPKPRLAGGSSGLPTIDRRSVTIRMDVADFGG